jgi:trk system potassium uptake protein TrkH
MLLINALFLLISSIISAINAEQSFLPLFYSSIVTALFGIFPLLFVPSTHHITNNEGLVIVVSSWLLSCLSSTLPYVLWGGEFTFTNAWFESVSGYTTTGSSILTNVEVLPLGLLFWRATTHWIGGMGVIIFALSVLPSMGTAGMVLYRLEMSPLAQQDFRQNTRATLRIILSTYIGLTVLEIICLLLCGMNLFDSIINSFCTIPTGGFSNKNTSIAFYNNVWIEIVIMIFMVVSALHFGLLFSAIFKRSMNIFKSTIVRYYILALVIGIIITTLNLHGSQYKSWFEALRYSSFQIISVGTTTGFATADSSIWPPLGQILLIIFTLQGGCAGSTAGGIKPDRIVMFGKAIVKQLKLLQHPQAVINVRINDKVIHDDELAMGILYICVYLVLIIISTILLIILKVDWLSAFSGVVATTGDCGPGLGTVGSMGNFNHIPTIGKWILSGNMLLGRFEIYGLIIFFQPHIWRMKIKR